MISGVLCWLGRAYLLVIVGYVVFSFVPRPPEPIVPVVRVVRGLVEPVLRPVRRVIPSLPVGGVSLDLSVFLVFLLLEVVVLPIFCGGLL